VLTSVVVGVQETTTTHVVRTKMSLAAFVSVVTRLFEMDAYATVLPWLSVEGPAVLMFGVPVEHVAVVPQIPFAAWSPSGARSRISGSPSDVVGFTGKAKIFDVPPPGVGLNTSI